MQGKSNSFLQITPFIPKSGLLGSSYLAFPIDVSITIVGPEPPPPPDAPIFEQYDGPFEGIRFLTQTIEGENRQVFSFSFLGVDHSHAAGAGLGGTTDGISITQWSGNSTLDPIALTYSGPGITATAIELGVIPSGVNFYRPAHSPVSVTTNTFEESPLTSAITSRSFSEGPTAGGNFVKRWFSETPGPSVGGYFAGSTMARMWSDGWTVTLTYSNLTTPVQLGIPIARIGDPARTQHITDYDPITFTYLGNKSRVRQNVEIPGGRTKLYGDFIYLVTPDNGDDQYFFYDSHQYDVVPGTSYNAITWFPWIVDATVYYVSGSFSFNPSYYLGYPVATDNPEVVQLPISSNWPEIVEYVMPPVNAESWDQFDDYGGTDMLPSQYLLRLFTGYGWGGEWVFFSTDPVDAYDDFEIYEDGLIAQLTQGVGFAGAGFFFMLPPNDAYDEFETYTDGTIFVLDFPGPFWSQDGFFI